MKLFKSTYAHLVLMTLAIAVLVLLLKFLGLDNILHNQVWNILLFFFFLTLLTGYLSQLILKNGKENFVLSCSRGTIFRFLSV
jgi:hypothetical protein